MMRAGRIRACTSSRDPQQLSSFGPAIDHLRTTGGTVTRMGWDGDFLAVEPVDVENETALMTMPTSSSPTPTGCGCRGCRRDDLLADDWVVL